MFSKGQKRHTLNGIWFVALFAFAMAMASLGKETNLNKIIGMGIFYSFYLSCC